MATDWIEIILGSGAVATLVTTFATLFYNWRSGINQDKIEDRRQEVQRDYETRQYAKDYYMKLYGHIAIIAELVEAYYRSLEEKGGTMVFSFKDFKFKTLTSKEILNDFNEAYENFSSYYIKQICDGYEIFISKNLSQKMAKFWHDAKAFRDNNDALKDAEQVKKFEEMVDTTTDCMEKLFGLKE